MSPSSTALNGCVVFQSGCVEPAPLRDQSKGKLKVDWLLRPERSVVIKRRNALGYRANSSTLLRHAIHKIDDGGLSRLSPDGSGSDRPAEMPEAQSNTAPASELRRQDPNVLNWCLVRPCSPFMDRRRLRTTDLTLNFQT